MLQKAYAEQGRKALFVLPSPDIAVAFPIGARIISTSIDFTPEEQLETKRYAGRVKGTIFVVMQSPLVATAKRDILLRSFVDYDLKSWKIVRFGETTVFMQGNAPE